MSLANRNGEALQVTTHVRINSNRIGSMAWLLPEGGRVAQIIVAEWYAQAGEHRFRVLLIVDGTERPLEKRVLVTA